MPRGFEYGPALPSVYNNPELTAAMTPTLAGLPGEDKVREWKPQMIAEDFSAFARKVPGLYLFLGVKDPAEARMAPVHSPAFSPDERSIPPAIRIMSHLVRDALGRQSAAGGGPTGRQTGRPLPLSLPRRLSSPESSWPTPFPSTPSAFSPPV